LWRGDTVELSNLELEGGRHIPGLLSCGCGGTVTGGLGSSLEGGQGIGRESRSLHRGGSARGSRLHGCGELLLCHVLDGSGGTPDGGEGHGKDHGVEVDGLGGECDGILRGGLGRHGSVC
jgi:hypothetical protein